MPNFTQRNQREASKRGRPLRHESERLRTIAWYQFLEGDTSPTAMTRWLSFSDIDQATIYRYRKGQITPRADVLNADDEVFQIARSVYEIGPFDVPLWEAMWGSLGPADFKRADDLMPGREWAISVMNEMFFEDPILARIVGFRKTAVAIERMTSDLEAFTAAIRVCRACRVLMRGNALALRVLLEGTLALPGARGLLGRLGLVEPLREWIVAQFEGTEADQVDAAYRAPWMESDQIFFDLCRLADVQRLQVKGRLFSGRQVDFAHAFPTDPDDCESRH